VGIVDLDETIRHKHQFALGTGDPKGLHDVAHVPHRGVEHGTAGHLTRVVDEQQLAFREATDDKEVLVARVVRHGKDSKGH